MRGASAASFSALTDALTVAVDKGVDTDRLAADLFGVAEVLDREPGLRRVLTDASLDASARTGLVQRLFQGKLDDAGLDLVAQGATLRWAATRDFGDAVEQLGVIAVVKGAEKAGEGDRLQDDLFGISRTVERNPELRDALADTARSADEKRTLLHGLLEGKVTPAALQLAGQAVAGSHRTVIGALDEYQRLAAEHRNTIAATVRVARPLGDEETKRLQTALASKYGRPVHTNVVVDPDVLGGVKIEIGDEVIDGTIASRLDDARRRLAG